MTITASPVVSRRFPPGYVPLDTPNGGTTECLMIAQADYGDGADGAGPLDGPHDDCTFIRKSWIDAGQAAPRLLLNPSLPIARAALAELSNTTASTLWFFFAGHGTLNADKDPVLTFPRARSDKGNWESHGLSLTEVIRALARPSRHLVIVVDAGLWSIDGGGKPPLGAYRDIEENGAKLEQEFGPVTLLYSSSPGQGPADALEDQPNRSPFALAFSNALARSDLNSTAFAEVIRSEVQAMTQGLQTPKLLTTPRAARLRVLPDQPARFRLRNNMR
jgi:hypothetical protein